MEWYLKFKAVEMIISGVIVIATVLILLVFYIINKADQRKARYVNNLIERRNRKMNSRG